MSVSCNYFFGMTTRETLESGVPAVTTPILTHDAYNESATLNATSTPPATQVANFLPTLTAGAATINLAALNARQRRELDRWISRPGTPDVGELIKRLTR